MLRDVPQGLRVCLLVDEDGSRFILNQGLYVSTDRVQYQTVPVEQTAPGTLSARMPAGGDVWIATRLPYGRDGLDRLLADTHGAAGLKVRIAARGGRIVPIFEFGAAGSGRPVHWFVAAEDAWETASSLVADAMIRQLAGGGALAEELLAKAAVRIVPLLSPYSATQPAPSYLTTDGRSLYGAATWADEPPPPEYALIRDEVTAEARAGRLGLLLTLHSYQAQHDHSQIECIRMATGRQLSGKRLMWAEQTVAALVRGIPKTESRISEKIWHPGLARDYMLAAHNAITFRIEVTTAGLDAADFLALAKGLLANTAAIEDWTPVLPTQR